MSIRPAGPAKSKGAGRRSRSRCPACGKLRFRDHKAAVTFLHSARNARQRATLDGADTGHREVRAYWCDACSGWHVTSQPRGQRSRIPA